MPKKVLILANNSGGLYCFRKELINELMKTSEVVVATPFDDYLMELRETGVRLIELNMDRRGINPRKDFSLFCSFLRVINHEKPELIILYTIKPNIYGGLAAQIKRVPYAANITGLGTAFENGGFLRKLVTILYRLALRKAKVVFFENCTNKDLFVDTGIIQSDRTCVLQGAGVNTEHFHYQEYPHNRVFKFLFIGRVMREKGIDELLSAMQTLIKQGEKCHLDILGGFDEDYQIILKEKEAEGWLTYYGIKNDVRPYIAACDCFVLPSWHEGMANTNLECASSGRPVITSNIPGCKEAVIEGVSGLLCREKDTNSLSLVMREMMHKSLEERKMMGIEGRKHMMALFDKYKVVQTTIDHLDV